MKSCMPPLYLQVFDRYWQKSKVIDANWYTERGVRRDFCWCDCTRFDDSMSTLSQYHHFMGNTASQAPKINHSILRTASTLCHAMLRLYNTNKRPIHKHFEWPPKLIDWVYWSTTFLVDKPFSWASFLSFMKRHVAVGSLGSFPPDPRKFSTFLQDLVGVVAVFV